MMTDPSDPPSLTFYDVLSQSWPQTWSPYTMRILLTLKHLGLSYTHVPVSYPDIKPLLESLGVAPAAGNPSYTLPAITFPATAESKTYTIMGSLKIAQHLCSSTFCRAKKLFPQGDFSTAAALEFEHKVFPQIMLEGWMEHVLPFTTLILDPNGAEYIDETKRTQFGPLDEFRTRVLEQEIEAETLEKAIKRAAVPILKFYESAGRAGLGKKGVFYYEGEEPQYVDFCVVAAMMWGVMVRGDIVLEALDNVGNGRIAKIVRKCLELLV
jgi:glutathione S-transferase